MERENILLAGVAQRVNDSHVRSNLLLHGDEVNGMVVVAKSGLNLHDIEASTKATRVGLEGHTEAVQVFDFACLDHGRPSFLHVEFRDTSPVDATGIGALGGFVTGPLAKLADHLRTRASGMAFLVAEVAGAGESTLDAGIGAVGLVVANLAAVVALAGETSGLVGTLTSEVTFLIAAKEVSDM